jgi:hypothetical protein
MEKIPFGHGTAVVELVRAVPRSPNSRPGPVCGGGGYNFPTSNQSDI